jgi:hypothetical protein
MRWVSPTSFCVFIGRTRAPAGLRLGEVRERIVVDEGLLGSLGHGRGGRRPGRARRGLGASKLAILVVFMSSTGTCCSGRPAGGGDSGASARASCAETRWIRLSIISRCFFSSASRS